MSHTPRTDALLHSLSWRNKESVIAYAERQIEELTDLCRALERERSDLLAAAKTYMATCPADYDTTKAFKAASDALTAAIAKAEGK